MKWVLVVVLLTGCVTVEPSPTPPEPSPRVTVSPTPSPQFSRVLTEAEQRLWRAEGEYYRALCAPLFPVLNDSEQGYYCTADPLTPTEPPS
jgi:hypothetical protein